MKTKSCAECKQEFDTMYRVQKTKGKQWIFVCTECCQRLQQGPFYRYGGTWKGYRH